MKLKYVILTDGTPIVFGMGTAHSDIARPSQVVAAGFVELNVGVDMYSDIRIRCSGESVSLGKSSRPEDTRILTVKVFNESLS